MKHHRIVWRPSARADLLALYDWIAERADPDTALHYTAGIEGHAATLAEFSQRGTPRDDLVSGLRTITYRRRTIIAYRVIDEEVEILRLVHGGQDWSMTEDE